MEETDVRPFVYVDCSSGVKQELFYEEDNITVPPHDHTDNTKKNSKSESGSQDKREGSENGSFMSSETCDLGLQLSDSATPVYYDHIDKTPTCPVVGLKHLSCSDCRAVFRPLNHEKRCKACILSSLRKSNERTSKPLLECKICGQNFQYSTKLAIHIMRVHYTTINPSTSERSLTNGNGSEANHRQGLLSEKGSEKHMPIILRSRKRRSKQQNHQSSNTDNRTLTNVAVVQPNINHRPSLEGVNGNFSSPTNVSFPPGQASSYRNDITLTSLLGNESFSPITEVDGHGSSFKPSNEVEHAHFEPKKMKSDNCVSPYEGGSSSSSKPEVNFPTISAPILTKTNYHNLNLHSKMPSKNRKIISQHISTVYNTKDSTQNANSLEKAVTIKDVIDQVICDSHSGKISIKPNKETNQRRSEWEVKRCKVLDSPDNRMLSKNVTNMEGIQKHNKSNEGTSYVRDPNTKLQTTINSTINNIMNKTSNVTTNQMAEMYTERDSSGQFRNHGTVGPDSNSSDVLNVFSSEVGSGPYKKVQNKSIYLNANLQTDVEHHSEKYATTQYSKEPIDDHNTTVNLPWRHRFKQALSDKLSRSTLNQLPDTLPQGNIAVKAVSQINKDASRKPPPSYSSAMKLKGVTFRDSNDESGAHERHKIPGASYIPATPHNSLGRHGMVSGFFDSTNLNELVIPYDTGPPHNYTVCKSCQIPKRYDTSRGSYCDDCVTKHTEKGNRTATSNVTLKTSNICETCGENFPSEKMLNTHMVTHKTNSDFECSVCGVTFEEMNDVVRHELVCYREYQK